MTEDPTAPKIVHPPLEELLPSAEARERYRQQMADQPAKSDTTIGTLVWREIKVAVRQFFAPVIWVWKICYGR